MGDEAPCKADIVAVFKRLKAQTSNRICFDCGTNNPTWSSVTYGVFICIDCSAIHRGLGVHLSFVRSTQLDTNWTWLQLRAMQLGGNSNATQFFQQHGCNSSQDAQMKYKSRAAQLYREKLHSLAVQAMRLHGTKLHIEGSDQHSGGPSPKAKDADFFEEHSSEDKVTAVMKTTPSGTNLAAAFINEDLGEANGLNVESALNSTPSDSPSENRKTLIGQKKATAGKKLGGKKGGLGAQRVKANFEEIEKAAENLDKERENAVVAARAGKFKETKEVAKDNEKGGLSSRLMMHDLSEKAHKNEAKLKHSDPNKGDQAERLGIGLASGNRSAISHSVFSDMKVVEQEGKVGNKKKPPSKRDILGDEWDIIDSSGGGNGRTFAELTSEAYSGFDRKNDRSWDDRSDDLDEFFDAKEEKSISSTRNGSVGGRSSKSSSKASFDVGNSDEAQKKYGGAKALSSDMFSGDRGDDFETRQTFSRFEGSNSISSSDFFGTDSDDRKGSAGSYASSYNMPDVGEIKDSVRVGVNKVAGRLSQLSTTVNSYLQDYR